MKRSRPERPASTPLAAARAHRLELALVALAAFAAFGPALRGRAFLYDDVPLIRENPYLHQGLRTGAAALLRSGYWQASAGRAAPVAEYRPVLMLSFLLQAATTGFSVPAMRLGNVLLHVLVCLLLWELFRRKLGPPAAFAGALIFAVLPVHSEAVGLLSGRSEVLSAAFVLGAWLALEDGRRALGFSLYAGALLSKESSVLFPVLLALDDWTFRGRRPWDEESRGLHGALWGMTAAYLLLRFGVLADPFRGGRPYFSGRLAAALTFARFAVRHYVWPSLSGLSLCSDYSRPLIPDANPSSPSAWLPLAAWLALFAWAVRSLRRREPWAFWLIGPGLFLLPTSNLILPLDTIGAERFLYLPSVALAAGGGWLYQRLRAVRPRAAAAALGAVAAFYIAVLARRDRVWLSPESFYRAQLACNPLSAGAAGSLGLAYLQKGDAAHGLALLETARALDPADPAPDYNLAKYRLSVGDAPGAESALREALRRDPSSSDAWVLLSVVEQRNGRTEPAAAALRRALTIRPDDPKAQFDLGRLYWLRSERERAAVHWRRFLELAPDDPDAPAVRRLLRSSPEP
ncbi:MAG: tetratricopeptide repeat protein [Elusimicrobia bacterium]|nr:tetratricopeptide repeat protein [Elusimicrobiota bacterium]